MRMGIDLNQAADQLRKNGISIGNETSTLLDIAEDNNITPQQVYLYMQEGDDGKRRVLPKLPPPGIGRKTIQEICEEYALDVASTTRYLVDQGLKAAPNMTLKDIAEESNDSPSHIYEMIRQSRPKTE